MGSPVQKDEDWVKLDGSLDELAVLLSAFGSRCPDAEGGADALPSCQAPARLTAGGPVLPAPPPGIRRLPLPQQLAQAPVAAPPPTTRPAAPAPSAQAKDFVVGQRVQRRDRNGTWATGYVKQLLPLEVSWGDNPAGSGYRWDEVRPLDPSYTEEPRQASPSKVPSVFGSGNKADLEKLKRHVFPNIFAWNAYGGEGVEDDVSSLQLRAAARLRARQAELLAREKEFGLGSVWEVQRQEMREADSFLDAFDRNEAKSFPWAPAAPPPMPCHPTGFPSRLPAQRWPPWHRPTKAEYMDELLRANPAGCGVAVQLGTAEQEMMLNEQRRVWEGAYPHAVAMARDAELRKWYQQAAI